MKVETTKERFARLLKIGKKLKKETKKIVIKNNPSVDNNGLDGSYYLKF